MKNIVYLHTHDTGRYIEPYDRNVQTPNLMKMAQEGTLFRNAYCCGPTCSPSRSALLTGKYPHNNGMYGLAHRGFSLNDYSEHAGNYLRQFGYETVLCGVQHEAADAETIGYSRIYTKNPTDGRTRDEATVDSAVAFLKEKHEKPFFLSVGLFSTHRRYPKADESIRQDYVKVPFCIPDNPWTRKDYAEYLTSAIHADQCLGRVLDCLKELDMEKDTFIFYTTDHGIAFPHMKCNLTDSGIGVSLIIKYPGNKSVGRAKDAMVSHIDILPTLLDWTGIPKPDYLAGTSLLPVLEGHVDEVHDAVFAEVTYHASIEPQRCIRTNRYKYIVRCQDWDKYALANIDGGYTKSFLLQNGMDQCKIEMEMLYDLYMDPAEGMNLAGNPEYAQIKAQMKERLWKHMEETQDFFLVGEMPRVKGAYYHKITCIEPTEKDPDACVYL